MQTDERVTGFDSWWEHYGQPYEEAVIANGDTPWAADLEERRQLWERRYTRPAPPRGLLTELADIRGTES